MKSDIFPEGVGYFQYGGGAFIEPSYIFYRPLNTRWVSTIGFQISKKYIPSSWVPEDLKFVADAINSLPAENLFIFKNALKSRLTSNIDGELGAVYLKKLSGKTDDGRNEALYYYGKGTINLGHFQLGLGYKFVTLLEDYDEKTYMASIRYNW